MTKTNTQDNLIQPNINIPTYQPAYQDDEIDLRELLKVIWDYKWLTVALCTLAIIGSVFYALNAQEWWVAKCKVVEPQLNDVATLYTQTNVTAAILSGSGVAVPSELKHLFEPKNLFGNFINEFNSAMNKKLFLEKNPVFIHFLKSKKTSENEVVRHVLDTWMQEIKLAKDKESAEVELSFRAPTKTASADLLKEYIQFVSDKVKENQIDKFMLFIETEKQKLQVSLKIVEERTQKSLDRSLKTTEYAYQIANKAGLDSYKANLNQKSEMFEISLGKKALKAKVEVLKSIDDLSVLNASISTMKMALVNLDKLNFSGKANFSPFRYLDNVEPPLNRAAPKRALIVILATLLAGMLSIFIALVHYFMTKKQDD